MRADRLISLMLLLRSRGRMTADDLAAELEVSTRTVLRDVEALSVAGVPVYAERGRHGGYSLLPGFRTDLAGLNHHETLALVTAGAGHGERAFGLGSELASAMRKVVDALPEGRKARVDEAASRFLLEPETDLLSRRRVTENVRSEVMTRVRQAVLVGRRLRIQYAAPNTDLAWHTVDPIGLVTVRGRAYLLATKSGGDRTYRLTRMQTVDVLPERADRPVAVDLDQIWAQRVDRFLSDNHIPVRVRVECARRDELLAAASAVRSEYVEADGRLRVDVTFEDLRHAVWAIWQLDTAVEVVSPEALRTLLRERAETIAARYGRASLAESEDVLDR